MLHKFPRLRRLHRMVLKGGRQIRSAMTERELSDPKLFHLATRIRHHRPDFEQRFAGSEAQFAHLALGFVGQSKAATFQDVWALKESGFKRDGYFVEIGAFDGVDLSNTYLLEKDFGWTGLLVEPNPHHHAAIRARRTAALSTKCVDAVSGKKLKFWITRSSALSALADFAETDNHARQRAADHEEIEVETISLNDLLAEYKAPADIGFVSVDTEGNEPEILSTFDFKRWRPRLWCIEHNRNRAKEAAIDATMARNGYTRRYAKQTGVDGWYASL